MKIFAVVTLSAFLVNVAVSACCYKQPAYYEHGANSGGLSTLQCNIKRPCPQHYNCVYAIADDYTGVCKKDTVHKPKVHKPKGYIDYNRATRAFTSADTDHDRKITFGGAHKALHSLVPGASQQMLNKLTRNGDKNKDGYLSYSEFVVMYRVLLDKTKHQGNPNDKCRANPCKKNQMCRNCQNARGYCCETIHTVPSKTPAGELTQSERAQVNNIYTALNTNKDKGVSRKEFNKLLMAVRQTMGHDTVLFREVYKYVVHGDTNHDQIVGYFEFLRACQILKSKDPKSFPVFLNALTKLKPLALGAPCVTYGKAKKACPAGSSCQRTLVQGYYNHRKYSTATYVCRKTVTSKRLKPKCFLYHDCTSCVVKGRHKILGALCGWKTGWGGRESCQATSGSSVMPLVTSAGQCPQIVVVHGRE